MRGPLDYRKCRELGAGPRLGTPGKQLDLFGTPRLSRDAACHRCGRKAYFWVRLGDKVVGLCDWHTNDRLPIGVRRSAFAHLRRL